MSCDDPACGREEASSSWSALDQEVSALRWQAPHNVRRSSLATRTPSQSALNASLSAFKRLDRDVQPSQTSAKIPPRPSAQGRLICAP
jgi:hypothetical protein